LSDKPWLLKYDIGVPSGIEYPQMSVTDLLSRAAKENEEETAIIAGERSVTYGDLEGMASNLAAHLMRNGVKTGEVVGICLPNSIDFVIAFFAILKCGAVAAAMNPSFPKRELKFQVGCTGMKVVVTCPDKVEDFLAIAEEGLPISHLVQSGNDFAHFESGKTKIANLEEVIKNVPQEFKFPTILETQAAVVQFSGGTTGAPKAALGSHLNLVANAMQFRHWLVNIGDGETFLIAIPLYHVYGLVLGLILGVACHARMVLIEHPGLVDEILDAIVRYPVSYFPAVPTIFNRINQHPSVVNGNISLSSIKACISGSAPLLESVRREFENNTGGSLVEGYGLSEAPTATHCNPILGEKRSGSIGLPLPDVDCKIVNMEDGMTVVDEGEEGELWISGPQVMMGYLNNPGESELTLRDGWLRTGDIARMDADGYFYLSGRMKELIKVHGMQVWPTEVEEVVDQHPAVMECAAAGIPDESSGERVKIWVVLQPGEDLSLADVVDFCQEKLAGYKIPAQLEVRNSLPKTGVGKILRRVLLEEHNQNKR
jgi:long-chain acyl-CoA synthetase